MKKTAIIIICLASAALIFSVTRYFMAQPDPDEAPVPSPTTILPQEVQTLPSDKNALAGYNLLIADRGNNRLLEVTPDKKTIWQYDFSLPRLGLGADDSFFTDGGKTIIVNLELYHLIEQIDYQTKSVIWSYGVPGVPGSGPGYLNRPDDAYKLPNGDVISADIKNCRIIEISPDKQIVRQYGVTGVCGTGSGYLDSPNGDTPLPNGHILISNIRSNSVIELDQNWKPILNLKVPLKYPSDPQPTKAGNILIADYSDPGKIIEITRSGDIVWNYDVAAGPGKLSNPSLAIELPNGNILATDDFNNRVVVIDKSTKQIIWQYGVTGKPGTGPGQLSIPDGLDIISATASPTETPAVIHSVGELTHHPQNFLGQEVSIQGYLLAKEGSYAIFSDESSGSITTTDLPVIGQNITQALPNHLYVLTGKLIYGGLSSVNKNPYHFELSSPI